MCSTRLLASLAVVVVVTTACGPNPGELGYLGNARYDVKLEGRVSRMPIAVGTSVSLDLYDETGECYSFFGGCPDYTPPFSVVTSNADVFTVAQTTTVSGSSTHVLTALEPGRAELFVKDAEGTLVDFLPLEAAAPSSIAVTDMSYAHGYARALPSDIGIPTSFEVALRIGVSDLQGRMLLTGSTSHVHVEVREAAAGLAIGPDEPRSDATSLFGGEEDATLPPLAAESPLGVVAGTASDHLRVLATEPGRMRVEIPALSDAIAPLSLRISGGTVSTGAIGIDVIESDVDDGTLSFAHLCARHAVDDVEQAGWPYDWQGPSGFVIAPAAHESKTGGANRCVTVMWDLSTSFDARTESFSVSFGALSAEIPASLVAAHAG